jgi:D-alanyl-D-alanine carboxypeptidase
MLGGAIMPVSMFAILLTVWMSFLSLVAISAACAESTMDGSVPASSNAPSPDQENLKQRLERIRSKYYLDKVWVRVETSHGDFIEVELGGAGRSDDVMIGSLTKLVTGVAVAILIQQGKLTLQTKLGDLMDPYFRARGKTLDDSLREVSVERLLTHTAGLRTNYSSDPVNGIDNSLVFRSLGLNSSAFDYLIASGGDKSNGDTKFVYSNISYLLLGLVIEQVSGQSYEQFCNDQIFAKQGISDAAVPGFYKVVAPFAGWRMTVKDLTKVISVFDINNPTILTRETLQNTLLGDLGAELGQNKNVHYALGVYVKKGGDGNSYFISHNGIANFFKHEQTYYSYMEASFPGARWVFSTSPAPKADGKEIAADVRRAIGDALNGQ